MTHWGPQVEYRTPFEFTDQGQPGIRVPLAEFLGSEDASRRVSARLVGCRTQIHLEGVFWPVNAKQALRGLWITWLNRVVYRTVAFPGGSRRPDTPSTRGVSDSHSRDT